jgi:protein-S-isoprenylcysteine O-methyltransferase Ste14
VKRLRRKLLRARLLPVYLGGVALFVLAEPGLAHAAAGSGLVAAGLALRAWGAGHLVKTRRLATRGPYAHIRHPLYAGALLMGLGFGVTAGGPGLALVLVLGLPGFLLYYLPYKERIESARLERRYGAAYAAYRARVPALLPAVGRRLASSEAAGGSWSLARYRDNHESGVALAALGALLLLLLRPVLPL